MEKKAPLQIAIMLSSGLLVAACGGRKDAIVPTATPVEPPAASQMYVVVQRGQTLDALAERFGIDKAAIIALNNLKPPYGLKPGAVLKIPALLTAPEQEKQTIEPPRSSPPPARAAAGPSKSAPAAADAGPAQSARPKRQPRPKTAPEVIPLD